MTPDAISRMENQYSIFVHARRTPSVRREICAAKSTRMYNGLPVTARQKAYSPPEHIPFHKYHVEIPADEIDEKYKPEEIGGVLFECFVIPPQSPQKEENEL